MQIIVSTRHSKVTDELKERAQQQVARLEKLAQRPVSVEVLFDTDHGSRIVELRLTNARGNPKIASAEGVDFVTALDGAVAKLRKQLTRGTRRSNRRASADSG